MSIFWKSFFGKITATIFIAICVALEFGPEKWAKFLITDGINWISPRIAQYIFLIFALITFSALGWQKIYSQLSKLKTLVKQIFDDIEWIDEPHSIHTFGYIISKPHNLVLVGHLQLRGLNKSKTSIIVRKAYLRSLVTGEYIVAEIESLKAENVEIYSGAYFTFIVKFPNEDGHIAENNISGISFQSFLTRFSNFEIIIETDKKKYRLEFNGEETHHWISSVQIGLMMPQPSEKARVLQVKS